MARKVDVIVVGAAAPAARAAQRATGTIPIVFVGVAGPLANELAGDIARHQGNMTGMSYHATPEQAAKELEIIHELSNKPSRVVVLREYTEQPHASGYRPYVRAAADKLGVTLQHVEFSSRDGIDFQTSDRTADCYLVVPFLPSAIVRRRHRARAWVFGRADVSVVAVITPRAPGRPGGGAVPVLQLVQRGRKALVGLLVQQNDVPVEENGLRLPAR